VPKRFVFLEGRKVKSWNGGVGKKMKKDRPKSPYERGGKKKVQDSDLTVDSGTDLIDSS